MRGTPSGFVLQNSIAPVNGLKYNSQILIEKPQVKSDTTMNEEPKQTMYYDGQTQTDSTMP